MKLSANMIVVIEEAPEADLFREDRRTLNALAVRHLVKTPRLDRRDGKWHTRLTAKGRITKKNLSRLTNAQLLDIFGETPRLLGYCK